MERNKKRKKNRSNWSLIGDPGALRREEGGHEPLTVHEIIPPPNDISDSGAITTPSALGGLCLHLQIGGS